MTEQTVNLLPLVHRQDIATPEALLQEALPAVIAAVPNAKCAQVYRLARGGMVVWYSIDAEAVPGKFYAMEANSPYQHTIETGEPTIDERYNLLIAPLRGRFDSPFGLLTVECSELPTDAHLLDEIATQLGSVLYSKQLEQLLHRQVTLTSQFNQAESIDQIASIFAINSLIHSQFAAINVFDYATDGTLQGARAIVTANRSQTFPADDPIGVEIGYLKQAHESLLNQGDFLVSNVETDERLTDADRDWLRTRKARSLYFLPLYIQKQLYGAIAIIDTTNALAPTALEKQIYQNIAEQAASIIEKRRLLEQTENSLRESQLLYDLVGDLMQTQNLPQILEVLYKYVGEGTRNVTMSEIEYDANDMISNFILRYIIRDGQAHEIHVPWAENYSEAELKNATEFMREVGDDLEILEDYSVYQEQVSILKHLQKQGVNSSLAIPIFEDGRRVQQLTLAWRESRQFDDRLMQLMRTAKSQIALVLRNQELIAQSQTAATESQQQANQLQQIADFGQAMQASLQLEEILKTVLEYSRRIISGDYVAVLTYDRHIENFRQSAQHWQDEAQVTLPGALVIKDSDTLAQEAWDTRNLIHVESLQADWVWQHPHINILHSMLVAPLVAGGVALGILEVGSLQDKAFSASDVAAFRQMTNQLAVAIANAETYSQSQRLARNKVQANEIIAHLQQQADVTSILQVTAQELGKALGAKRARIRLGLKTPSQAGD
jgi:GAF domain-containing protein